VVSIREIDLNKASVELMLTPTVNDLTNATNLARVVVKLKEVINALETPFLMLEPKPSKTFIILLTPLVREEVRPRTADHAYSRLLRLAIALKATTEDKPRKNLRSRKIAETKVSDVMIILVRSLTIVEAVKAISAANPLNDSRTLLTKRTKAVEISRARKARRPTCEIMPRPIPMPPSFQLAPTSVP